MYSNQMEALERWIEELSDDGFWKTWDRNAYAQHKRFFARGGFNDKDAEVRQKILELLAANNGITPTDLAQASGACTVYVRRVCQKLQAQGQLLIEGRQLFFQNNAEPETWQPAQCKSKPQRQWRLQSFAEVSQTRHRFADMLNLVESPSLRLLNHDPIQPNRPPTTAEFADAAD
jgi:hypothetical protein